MINASMLQAHEPLAQPGIVDRIEDGDLCGIVGIRLAALCWLPQRCLSVDPLYLAFRNEPNRAVYSPFTRLTSPIYIPHLL